MARILRFQNGLAHTPAAGCTWAETAAMCGYHDQAHLAREFRALTGLSATEFQVLVTNDPASDNSPIDGCFTSVRCD
ncbi:AraC family transcriptional regulator [Streptomyces avidinii]|uniref:AraC family transcriptional regulator n=1 Tax=Streptomyces avidinii TaxID=1895 RepID=UPI003868BBB3